MKSWKKILSGTLAGVMILSAAVFTSAANVTFTDTGSHWAKSQINYLVSKDVLNGYKQKDGTYTFNPDGTVTRAEFVKMLDETFGLTATIGISYSDVKTSDWFHPYFSKAAAQGYLLNYGTSVNPNGKLTREEATTLLVRYLGIQDGPKAAVSTFADYSKISSNFQGPVMAAVQAGLITGYNENGGTYFKPQGTLTRAEALTILYRAAGAIYKTSAYSKESGAPDTNTTITRGDVTVSGMILGGRVIITEGAAGGTVTLTGCSVTGNLEIRGASNLILDNCTVSAAVLESIAPSINISLSGGTTVSSLELLTTASMNISTGCKVTNMAVEEEAKNIRITGDGVIENLTVNASGFVSTMMPKNFSVLTGFSANFASQVFSGSSADQASFVNVPYMTEENGKYVLHVTPESAGKVYYYFTKQSYKVSAGEFMSAYSAANVKGSFNVQGGVNYSEKTESASVAEDYSYVVIQLITNDHTYAPILIDNEATSGTGFYVDPYFDGRDIAFQTDVDGTIYYYYSDDGDARSAEEFQKNYRNASSSMRSTDNVEDGEKGTIALNDRHLESYPFVIIALQGKNGQYYIPVVVAAGDNGFKEEPTITTMGKIEYTPNLDGTLYYYYTKSESMPTPQYVSDYWRTEKNGDYVSVVRNKSATLEYDTDTAESYPYMVLCIKDSAGNFLTPVMLKIDLDTGFSVQPYVSATDEITFRAEEVGTVYWYFTKYNTMPTMKEFMSEWRSSPTRQCGTAPVNSSSSYTAFTFDPAYISSYPYIAMMLVDADDTQYQPVLVDVKNTTTTGFTGEPYCDLAAKKVYFYPGGDGEVYYYFSPATSAYNETSEEFWDSYRDHSEYGHDPVTKGLHYLEFDDINTSYYKGVMIMYVDSQNRDHYPVYVSLLRDTSAGNSATGLTLMSVTDSEAKFYAHVSGTVYYTLRGIGSRSDYKGYKTVSRGDPFTISVDNRYYSAMDVEMDGYDDFRVDLTEDYNRDDAVGDGSNKEGYGLNSLRYDSDEYKLTGIPLESGTLRIYLGSSLKDDEGLLSNYETIEVKKNQEFEYTLPDMYQNLLGGSIGGGNIVIGGINLGSLMKDITIQLYTSDGGIYEEYTLDLFD